MLFSGVLTLFHQQESLMAEIKSSLELAMEKTKKYEISEEEKKEIRRKETIRKATAFSHRYREGSLSLNEIQKEMGRIEEKGAEEVKEYLLSRWIEDLTLSNGDERLLEGIGWLKHRTMDEIKGEFRNLLIQYEKEKGEIEQEIRTQSVEALRKDGIDGDAVDPNVEKSLRWEKENKRLDQSYRIKLEALKEKLRAE